MKPSEIYKPIWTSWIYTCNVPCYEVTDITVRCDPYDLDIISCCVKTLLNKNLN